MSSSNFQASLAFVLLDEGGNDDDPADHGGRTSRGITQREWDAWRAINSATVLPADVWQAPDEQVAQIYHDHYWIPWADKLPVGVDYLYFDFCVNAGPHRATKILQRAIGCADDGIFGPITLFSATKANPKLLIAAFTAQKNKFYRALRQPRFLRGWLARSERAADRAIAMLSSSNQGVATT